LLFGIIINSKKDECEKMKGMRKGKMKKLLAVFVALTVLVGSLNFVALATDDATGGYGADVSVSESVADVAVGENDAATSESDFTSDGENAEVGNNENADESEGVETDGYVKSEYATNEPNDEEAKYNGDKTENNGSETNEENNYYDYNYEYSYEQDYKYEEKYEEEELEEYLIPIVPFNGGFSVTITGGGSTVDFGAGSIFTMNNHEAHNSSQTVRISDGFPAGSQAPVVVMYLEHGMELGVVVPGFTGTGNNRTFNLANLPPHLDGIVTGGRWIPSDPLVQDRTGHTFQANSGMLVYTLASGTLAVEVSPQIRPQRNFGATANPGITRTNPISVETFTNVDLNAANLSTLSAAEVRERIEAASVHNVAKLETYFITGQLRTRMDPGSPTVAGLHRFYTPGTEWSTFQRLNLVDGGGIGYVRPIIEEQIITLHVDSRLNIQGIRSVAGTPITDGVVVPVPTGFEPMLQNVTIDRGSNPNFDIVTFTLVQPDLSAPHRIELYGTIPLDATPGPITPTHPGMQNALSITTPIPGGYPVGSHVGGQGNITITASFVNRLRIQPLNTGPELNHSPIPTDGALDFLGGFRLDNEFADYVTNQAVRVFFENPAIGVQALRIPVGFGGAGDGGFANLYVRTSAGRTFTYASAGVLVSNSFAQGANGQRVVNLSFLNVLETDEFIEEIYWEILGDIPQGWRYGTGQHTARSNSTNFYYLGQVLDRSIPALTARAIVGEIDPNTPHGIVENPSGTAPNDPMRIRDEATTTVPIDQRTIINRARFPYSVGAGNLTTVLQAGDGFSSRNVTFNAGNLIYVNQTMPLAVRGHYVYLRAPYGILEIARETIEVTWNNQTLTEGKGIIITEIIDSTGSTVFRLALPDVIMGIFTENFATGTGTIGHSYGGITVHFDVRALPSANTQSFPINQVAMIIPMNPEVTPSLESGARQATTERGFTIDNRVAPGMWVAGMFSQSVNIQEQAELQTWVTARSVDNAGNTLATTAGHEWETGFGWLNLVPNGGIEKEFHYFNNTDEPVGQFHAFVPIPKAGEMMPIGEIEETLRPQVQQEAFEFSLDLLYEVATIPGFTITYSTVYTFDLNSPSFVAWGAITDTSQIRMVRIISYRNIAPGEMDYFLFRLGIPVSKNTVDFASFENIYAPLTFSEVRNSAAQRRSLPIAMRMWNYVVFHYNYARTGDGIFGTEAIQHLSTVSAPNPAPTREGYTFVRWTTDTANTIAYDFATAVTVPVLNLYAEWLANQSFNVTYTVLGEAPASFTPAIPVVEAHREGITGIAVASVLTTTETTRTRIVDGESVTENGTWAFNGWVAQAGLVVTNGTFTMPGDDVVFTGTWTFTPSGGGTPGGTPGNGGDDEDEEQELIKNPDRTIVRVGETIDWTLRGFQNPLNEAVVNFSIMDIPSRGLNFKSGTLPAFTNSAGVTFEVRYRVYGSDEFNVYATDIDASRPFNFSLPQSGDLYYTAIKFYFGNVPVGFGLGDEIVLTFIVGDDAPDNTLVNQFIITYNDREIPGYSPERPTVIVPPTGGGNGSTGDRTTTDRHIVIGEEGVPLGEWVWDEETEEWIFIEDIETPLGLLQIPQTGLGNNNLGWTMLWLSLFGMAILFVIRRKEGDILQEHIV